MPFPLPKWPDHVTGAEVDYLYKYFSLLSADGGKTVIRNELTTEHVEPTFKTIRLAASLPDWVKRLLSLILSLLGLTRASRLVTMVQEVPVSRYWSLLSERNAFRSRFLSSYTSLRLDAVITPAHSLPAVPHHSTGDLTPTCTFPMLFNVLDWPAAVVPVSIVTKRDEEEVEKSFSIKDKLSSSMKRAAKGSIGLPVGVQVATRPYAEEECLGMIYISKKKKKKKKS